MKFRALKAFSVSSLVICLTFTGCASRGVMAPRSEGAPAAKSMTPADMEAAFKLAGTTTAEHGFLKELTGKWSATTKWWVSPDAPPEVTKGYASNYMTLDGKFLKQDYSGKWMKMPFKGTGLTGFDTVSKEFNSVWLDSMSTAMMYSSGSYDQATKTLTLGGEASCAVMNGKVKTRSVIKILDKNTYLFEMYTPGADGKEAVTLEITYKRAR